LDDFCDTHDTLAVGASERLHDWRIHSCLAGYRNSCSVDQSNSRTKTCVNDLQLLICPDYIY